MVNFISCIKLQKRGMLNLTLNESLAPILFQISIGGIGGFLIGFVMRKLGKVAIILGVVVFSMIFLAYTNIIDVDYNRLSETASNLINSINPTLDMFTPLLAHTTFIVSFIFGLIIGFKKE
jgi:uncharacterized membrane protein (Fun14 family)